MRNAIKQAPALKPRSSLCVPVSPTVFYRMHEGTGTTISDAFGYGGDLTMIGASSWGVQPWITPTPVNSTQYLQSNSNTALRALFRMDQPFGVMYQGIDFMWDGSTSTNLEMLTAIGTDDNIVGILAIGIDTSGRINLTTRGVGVSVHVDTPFTGYTVASAIRVCLLVEIVYVTSTTVTANLFANGVSASSISTPINLVANGATGPFGSVEKNAADNQAYTVGAMPNGIGARAARYLSQNGSAGSVSRWLAARHTTRDASLAQTLATELYNYPGELPVCLNGL